MNRVRIRVRILANGKADRHETESKILGLALARLSERTFSREEANQILGANAKVIFSKLHMAGYVSSCDPDGHIWVITPSGILFVALHSQTFSESTIMGNGTNKEIN